MENPLFKNLLIFCSTASLRKRSLPKDESKPAEAGANNKLIEEEKAATGKVAL